MSNVIEQIKVGSTTYKIVDPVTAQLICDNVESGTTASKTYTKGEYVRINDTLYKVTANIATGQAMTVGVNIAETNVGDELSQLNSDLANIGTIYATLDDSNYAQSGWHSAGNTIRVTKGKYVIVRCAIAKDNDSHVAFVGKGSNIGDYVTGNIFVYIGNYAQDTDLVVNFFGQGNVYCTISAIKISD